MSENPVLPPTPAAPEKGSNGLALASMLTGAFAYFLVLFHTLLHVKGLAALVLAPFSALAAIIMGHIAHRQIKQSNGETGGLGLARAGLIMGYLYFAFGLIALLLLALGAAWLVRRFGA